MSQGGCGYFEIPRGMACGIPRFAKDSKHGHPTLWVGRVEIKFKGKTNVNGSGRGRPLYTSLRAGGFLSGAGFAEAFEDYYGADGEGDYGGEGGDQHYGWAEVEEVGEYGCDGEGHACGVEAEWSAGGRGLRG